MAIMAALQQIDVALFDKVFHLGREYKAMTKGAITLSRSGDGYLQVLTPALVWLSGSSVGTHLCGGARDRDARRANHLLHHEEHAEASAAMRL